MKNKLLLIIYIVILFCFVPPVVNGIVTTPSCIGFISTDMQEAWINFYGALIGGTLTLFGVGWTINYTEDTRKEDQRKHEKDIAEEFNRRDIETKNNLAAQYKPILTVSFVPEIIHDTKFGMSKYEDYFIQNYIGLSDKQTFTKDNKRLVINLNILNIGRGEAKGMLIRSSIISSDGELWETNTREYKELYMSNGINIMFCKELTENEWEKYNNTILETPLQMNIRVDYYDLVGYHYSLQSSINIAKFTYMKDEEEKPISTVLVLNPYDSMIENEVNDERTFVR